jgi:hypothetical protein
MMGLSSMMVETMNYGRHDGAAWIGALTEL